jgi:hypothetical protein
VTNILDVGLSHGDFRLGGRFDLNLFADTPEKRLCNPAAARPPSWCGARYLDNFAVERAFLVWARDEFDATLGDFYASFGKGIALHVVKIDQLGQDTTIRGGKFHFHHRDVELIFVGGEFNPLDTDEATGFRAQWKLEPVLGGRLEYRLLDTVILGAHGVYIISDDPNATASSRPYTDHHVLWGAGFEVPGLWENHLSFSAEVDWQRTQSSGQVVRGPGAEAAGLAFYASATLNLGAFTLLGEYKHYDRFRLEAPTPVDAPYALLYSQPPTLERLEAEVYDNIGVSGGRLRLDWDAGTHGPLDLLAFANFGYFQNWAFKRDRVFDPYAGIELRWQEERGHLNLSGGMRLEEERDTGALYRRDGHVELDLEQPLSSRHSVKLSAVYLRRTAAGLIRPKDWNEVDLALSYRWSPYLSVAVSYERQDDPSIAGGRQGNQDPARGPLRDAPLLGAENYLAAMVQYFITPGTYLSLRAGQSRPGIKCLNGACRSWPGFAGVQLSAVGRFGGRSPREAPRRDESAPMRRHPGRQAGGSPSRRCQRCADTRRPPRRR